MYSNIKLHDPQICTDDNVVRTGLTCPQGKGDLAETVELAETVISRLRTA